MRMDEVGYHHKHDRDFQINRPNGVGDWLLLLVKSPAFFLIEHELVQMPANIVGYPDVSYFIKLFRSKVGISPLQFRQNFGNVSI